MSTLMTLLIILAFPIVLVAVPLWLILYFRNRYQADHSANHQDRKRFDSACNEIKHLQKRLENLEAILDQEAPRWREKD
ncbi:envelope stress response membrane protein PspB [Pelagibaculum spongiae]|uniref:Envelope stress response membrane protein PspB n=1 Tax=Pelagibaculum spongiae TaxID=2080658 RepID=A0A2V1GY86_9GAMM|nr:envelope stress response membrane protein PspB [Pelagibaculum spongiae]PVZ67695.1 envelope stress response membrane protein PspB [Pelagibaculum spongiae]